MGQHPYEDLPTQAFWKTGVCDAQDADSLQKLYRKRFEISPSCRIATAGSCFAQHIHRTLHQQGYRVLDVEPPPPGLPEAEHQRFGYGLYSARYGNVYSARQLRQLLEEAEGRWHPTDICWRRGQRWIDSLRPGVEPIGLDSPEQVLQHRRHHLKQVRLLLEQLDVFVFTLGLTECWQNTTTGTIYPLAPGTQAGVFDPAVHGFWNSSHGEALNDLEQAMQSLERIRAGRAYRLLLTVSPVPLTATSSGDHVLTASSRSKATLRCVAAELCDRHDHVAYFPSYELIHHPTRSRSAFADNRRSIRAEAVAEMMRVFLQAHGLNNSQQQSQVDHDEDALQCEEALLEQFAP